MRSDTSDYHRIFVGDLPLLDTRAPVEFARGAFPGAINVPLMTDEERHQIGLIYKSEGQAAAIALGHKLVSGELKRQRLEAWSRFALENSEGYLYCFRGGLRSQTVQHWLREEGIDYPLVSGGYKAMRSYLIEALDNSLESVDLVLVSGRTGTGKTRVIQSLANTLDLEGLAHHRGSSFGHLLIPQPSQIDFENAISIGLLKQLQLGHERLYLEDEGRLIGRLSLPDNLRIDMQSAPMYIVEESLESRVDVVLEDYVVDLGQRYAAQYAAEAICHHEKHLRESLLKIRKRLGGLLYQQIDEQIENAFAEQLARGDVSSHREWISTLLSQYYDPMYDYQLSRREGNVLGQFSRADLTEKLAMEQAS